MTTTSQPTRTRRQQMIRRTLSPLQKKREMALTILGVEKTGMAREIGASSQVISNIFNDRHRSPDIEKAVVKYLNKKLDGFPANSWERQALYALGMTTEPITVSDLGWPKPVG